MKPKYHEICRIYVKLRNDARNGFIFEMNHIEKLQSLFLSLF